MECESGHNEGRCGKVEVVPASRVSNLPLYEVFFVIDCRETIKYESGHIASALNFPPPLPFESKESCLAKFTACASANFCNDRWDPIVIYGDTSPHVVAHMAWVTEKLLAFIVSPVPQSVNDWFLRCMSRSARNIWVIGSGYEGFIGLYPPLMVCGPEPAADKMTPLPYQVSLEGGGPFIGSRAIEWTQPLIEAMGIQAVVLDKPATKVFDSERLTSPLEYFLCSIGNSEDSEEETLTVWSRNRLETLFERTTEFIHGCLQKTHRVLIQLEGRSVSAAIAVAWYMRYKHLTFDDARTAVFATTLRDPLDPTSSVLDKSSIFEKELRLWERSAKFASYV
jgi:hypothetical protein